MPRKQPLLRERLVIVTRGVEHHFNNAFDLAVHCVNAADVHTEAARDRRTHLDRLELFALDLAALDDVFGKGLEHGLLLKGEPQSFHVASQTALPMADGSERVGQPFPVPVELGPIRQFMNMDLSFYYWHVANHRIPFLWRFHNVHHLDPDLDVSTAVRFHFGEVGLSAHFAWCRWRSLA